MSTYFTSSKKPFFALILLASSASFFQSKANDAEMKKAGDFSECWDCGNDLTLKKLCAQRIKAKCIDSKIIDTEQLNASQINTSKLCVTDQFSTDTLSGKNISATDLCSTNFATENACVGQLTSTSACVGLLSTADFLQCSKYAATVIFSANTVYTLGSTVGFDTILDDPNNNVTLAPGYMSYTAPLTGYYIVTVQIDQFGLSGANTVVGLPVTNIELFVNGVITRQTFIPYLSFHDAQKGNYSALLGLKAGDVLTSRYNVFVMNDGAGFIPYAGTVTIEGNPGAENASLFKIHLLSVTCDGSPCTPCDSGCNPPVTGCAPAITGCEHHNNS